MDKYLGNKKSIVESLKALLDSKGITGGYFFDVFAGTTNVAQYFKQRGFGTISSDTNSFSKVLGEAYLVNNEFPVFQNLKFQLDVDDTEASLMITEAIKRFENEKIFPDGYSAKAGLSTTLAPLSKILTYLNNVEIDDSSIESTFFKDYYTASGEKSEYKSKRGTVGRRNYFSAENALRLGTILKTIRDWKFSEQITEAETYILLTAVIEEVTLNANVAGTFHDFNRTKLFPNALMPLKLRIPLLNVVFEDAKPNYMFKSDANELLSNKAFLNVVEQHGIDIAYLDPPYNFRQYSDYYHLLNFIAEYIDIMDLENYGGHLEYVRGQNMDSSFKSQYAYKESFASALTDLVSRTPAHHFVISYYDENNHWSHGKNEVDYTGRQVIVSSLESALGSANVEKEPYTVQRLNYQSRQGEKKKNIDELFFYGGRHNGLVK